MARHLLTILLLIASQLGSTAQSMNSTVTVGGGALLAGACSSATATVNGALPKMAVILNPESDPIPALTAGISVHAWVSSANTVTVRECALLALTPNSVTWDITVIQRQ
jgi:hypothetical protein